MGCRSAAAASAASLRPCVVRGKCSGGLQDGIRSPLHRGADRDAGGAGGRKGWYAVPFEARVSWFGLRFGRMLAAGELEGSRRNVEVVRFFEAEEVSPV